MLNLLDLGLLDLGLPICGKTITPFLSRLYYSLCHAQSQLFIKNNADNDKPNIAKPIKPLITLKGLDIGYIERFLEKY